mmetsp:Transcript_48653/g.97469  ORF Transcript_48653/g.97469 Transcript_48653/m.97469 type:complete len:200 (-) Transcript_48653:200-799(-)
MMKAEVHRLLLFHQGRPAVKEANWCRPFSNNSRSTTRTHPISEIFESLQDHISLSVNNGHTTSNHSTWWHRNRRSLKRTHLLNLSRRCLSWAPDGRSTLFSIRWKTASRLPAAHTTDKIMAGGDRDWHSQDFPAVAVVNEVLRFVLPGPCAEGSSQTQAGMTLRCTWTDAASSWLPRFQGLGRPGPAENLSGRGHGSKH